MKHDLTTGTWQDDTGCPIVSSWLLLLMYGTLSWTVVTVIERRSFHIRPRSTISVTTESALPLLQSLGVIGPCTTNWCADLPITLHAGRAILICTFLLIHQYTDVRTLVQRSSSNAFLRADAVSVGLGTGDVWSSDKVSNATLKNIKIIL